MLQEYLGARISGRDLRDLFGGGSMPRRRKAKTVKRVAARPPRKKGFLSALTNPSGPIGAIGAVAPAIASYGVVRGASRFLPAIFIRPRAANDEETRAREIQLCMARRRKAAPVGALVTALLLYWMSKKWSKAQKHGLSINIGSVLGVLHTAVQSWLPGLGALVGIETPPMVPRRVPMSPQQRLTSRNPNYNTPDPMFGISDAALDQLELEAEVLYGRRSANPDDAVRGDAPYAAYSQAGRVYQTSAVPPPSDGARGPMSQDARMVEEVEAVMSGTGEHPDVDMSGLDPTWSSPYSN